MATFVFFVFSLLCLAMAINVLRPHYAHPKWVVVSFLLGWLTGELALHVIAFQLSVVFLFVCFGVVDSFIPAVSLLICVTSWLLLSYHYFSGYKAKGLMDQIVIPHRRKEDNSSWSRHAELDTFRLIYPFYSWSDPSVQNIKDIVYHQVEGLNLKLDIRRARTTGNFAPVLFQIHGGAWTHGYGSKKEQGIPLMVEMAKRGWICVSIDYRLSPLVTMPEHIVDCKRALAWVKEHIHEYGGNPDFIVTTGGSAGGHLCALLGLSANDESLQPGFEEIDTSVQGCVPYYGIYDLMDEQRLQLTTALAVIMRENIIKQSKRENPELYRHMSPINHINANAPPFLIIHGDKDSLTSLGEAQYFASRLDEVSKQSVEFAEIAGAQHAFDVFSSLRSDYVLMGVAERLEQWHRNFFEINQK